MDEVSRPPGGAGRTFAGPNPSGFASYPVSPVYLHQVAAYLPEAVVTNAHFTRINGLASEWIIERTGIQERRKAGPGENANTMAIAATRAALAAAPDFAQASVDLIVAGTYTPHDTIFTAAH